MMHVLHYHKNPKLQLSGFKLQKKNGFRVSFAIFDNDLGGIFFILNFFEF